MPARQSYPTVLSAKDRLRLLEKVFKEGKFVSSVCREFGISRFTFYKWAERYNPQLPRNKNLENLHDRERKVKRYARQVPDTIMSEVKEIAAKNPSWGKRRIAEEIRKKWGDKAPGVHGIYNILRRVGLTTRVSRNVWSRFVLQSEKRILTPEQRLEAIRRVTRAGIPVTYVCKEFGISRYTFYKWLRRWEKGVGGVDTLRDIKPKFDRRYLRVKPEHEKALISLIIKFPTLSKYALAQKLSERIGPVVGVHGVYNVLLRNGLNRPQARFAYAQAHAGEIPTSLGLIDRIRLVWEQFITGLAPAPPPQVPYGTWFRQALSGTRLGRVLTSTRLRFSNVVKPFFISSFLTFLISFGTLYWIRLLGGATSASNAIGLILATVALGMGLVFFLYSFKYYLTLAIVLSFSQQEVNSNPQSVNGNGKRRNFLSWLLGLGRGPSSSLGVKNGRQVGPLGLTPNLEHVVLRRYPYVSIHIPFYNEKNVVERAIAASTNFDYKGDYEVILCDDSTDDTTSIIQRYIKNNCVAPRSLGGVGWTLTQGEVRPGVILKHLHRTSRSGFKGGALREALKHTDPRAEFITVFDADFVPYPDTLELFLKYFQVTAGTLDFRGKSRMVNGQWLMVEEEKKGGNISHQPSVISHSNIAAVQGYQWHVLNKSENWITRGVRAEYAGSYVIERSGTEIYSGLKQISGAVYMVRRDVLEEVGWETSITEDFQLTLKLYEAGYKVVYTPYIQAPAECVSTIKRLIRQRMRWAEGHSNNIRRMFARLMFGRWEAVNSKQQTVNSKKLLLTNDDLLLTKRKWIPSPLSLSEKLEFLYLSPYYLQAFFFLIGTVSWLISETIFRARLPFWTSLWGWSLVLTNMLALPLMNAVGLFLEESEERDYQGLISFVILSYILVPFQAYAALKGFLEKTEGPWFRTPKTGRITDIFTRGRFYRFIAGILPGRQAAIARIEANNSRIFANDSFKFPNSPYLGLATANNRFDNFSLKASNSRWVGRLLLLIVVGISTMLSYFGNRVPQGQITNLPIQARVEVTTQSVNYLPYLKSLFTPNEVLAASSYEITSLKVNRTFTFVSVILALSLLTYLVKKKRTFVIKCLRPAFVVMLVLMWLLASWPPLPYLNFPPKIQEAQAAFPTIFSTATSQQTSGSTTSNVTLPASVAAGDLIIAIIGADSGALTATWPSPWVEIRDTSGTGFVFYAGYLIASGGETTVAVTHTSERSNHIAMRIKAAEWHGTTPPEITTIATGSSLNPNPPSLTPSWGALDTLWVAIAVADDSTVPFPITAYPTNYSNNQISHAVATSAASIGMASRGVNAASEDPGTFTMTVTETWGGLTLAVRPTAVVVPGAPTLWPDDGGSNQIAFNNTRQNDTTPIIRASATHTSTFNRFQVEFNTASDFGGTAYTEPFNGTYSSGTQYNLQTTGTLGLPTTNGVTYYVRARASADGGANYGSWSSGTRTYTYTSTAGDAEWFQTTDEQFDTGTLLTDTETSGLDSVQLSSGYTDIVVDAVSSGQSTGGTSITISHATGAGADRLMLVGVSIVGAETVSTVTYGGVALTSAGFVANSDDSTVEIWKLVAPVTGTANVVVTFSAALAQSAVAGVVTFTGVDQSTPLGTFASAIGDNSSPATVNVSSATGELVFGVVCAEYEVVTTDPSQTQHWNISISGSGSTNAAGSTEAGAAPTVTTSWTLDPAYNHWAVGGISIKPATSVDRTVANGTDDATVEGSYSDTGTTLQFGGVQDWAANYGQGYRFTNITIPQGSTVTSAYLSIVSHTGEYIGIAVRLTAIDEDNTATFSSGSPPGSRAITSSYIAAETPNIDRAVGERVIYPTTTALQQTLGAAIDAVVNRAGWSSGNALAVVNNSDQDSGAVLSYGRGSYRTYNYGTPDTNGPKLHIEYTPASSSGTIMSPEIDFDWVIGQSSWGTAAFSTTETNGDIKLRVYYTVSTACDTIVPDGVLSGNSSGFDVSASPKDISSITPVASTYNKICLQATLTNVSGTPFLNDWTVTWGAAAAVTLTQNDFEFWVDNDVLTPVAIWGNPDIAENTALNAVPPSNDPIDPADEIRIRMNISVTGATLAASTEDFILQYKEAPDCTDATAWTDVDAAAGGGTWRFAASAVTDNTTLTTLLVSTSDVAGRYSKSDPTTTNPNAVPAGQEFEWDWHVEYNGTAAAKTYCFRMVKSPVAALDAYNADSYPRIDTRPGTADLMRHGNFFTTGVERGFFWAD